MMRKILFIVLLFFLTGCSMNQIQTTPTIIPSPTTQNIPTVSIIPAATSTIIPIGTPAIAETLDAFEARSQFLFHEPASNIIQFFLEIREAVSANDKEKLASLVYYPIGIYLPTNKPGAQKTIINNPAEFIVNYDQIVTPEWKNAIRFQNPMNLNTNWQGIFTYRGALWFSGICLDQKCQQTKYYIIAINYVLP